MHIKVLSTIAILLTVAYPSEVAADPCKSGNKISELKRGIRYERYFLKDMAEDIFSSDDKNLLEVLSQIGKLYHFLDKLQKEMAVDDSAILSSVEYLLDITMQKTIQLMQQSENPLLNENTLLLLDLISSARESALEVQQTFKNINSDDCITSCKWRDDVIISLHSKPGSSEYIHLLTKYGPGNC